MTTTTVTGQGIIAAISGETPAPPTTSYTPLRVIMAGASFETINGSIQDRPHTAEYLQAIMAPLGHVLKMIGAPGSDQDTLTQTILDHKANVVNIAELPTYRADAGVLGLTGEIIGDSYAEPYTTLPKIGEAIDAFDYVRKVYAIRPPNTVGIDWCYIRVGSAGQFTDAKWALFLSAWDDYMATNYPEVGIIDAYANWTDSKEYAPGYLPWGDWHLSTASAAAGARIIWARVSSELSPVDYTPADYVPDVCEDTPR